MPRNKKRKADGPTKKKKRNWIQDNGKRPVQRYDPGKHPAPRRIK